MSPEDIIERFNLHPNLIEGGYFVSAYDSELKFSDDVLMQFSGSGKERSLSNAIYYFLKGGDVSIMHKVTGDMLYHFYAGDQLEMLLLYPKGHEKRSEVHIFSNHLDVGGIPIKLVPGGTWLGSRLLPGGQFALMGVTMSPGFHPNDYSIAERKNLLKMYPEYESLIVQFTSENK